jgi:hypothetical protein
MVLGGFNLGDGTLLNFGTQTPTATESTGWLNDVQTFRTMARTWKGAHTTVPCVIVTYNEALFQYAASSGDMPDGTYGYWYLVGSQTGQSTRDYIVLAFTIGPGPAFFDYPSCYRGTSSPVVSPVSFAFPAVYGSGRSLSPVSYIDGVTS